MVSSASLIQVLIGTLKETQKLIVLTVNDPSDLAMIVKLARQFEYNKSIIEAAESWQSFKPSNTYTNVFKPGKG